MITVHHLADSRSQRVLWLLEELGLPYQVRRYERDPATMLAPPELKAVHPLGKSPVIDHETASGTIRVAETGAIVDYLGEAFAASGPGTSLWPAPGTEAHRQCRYFTHYAEGSAMPPLLLKLVFSQLPARAPVLIRPVAGAISKKAGQSFIDPQIDAHVRFWEQSLSRTGWFVGDSFSVADIMMSFPLEAASTRIGKVGESAPIRDFLARIHARPAYGRALASGGDYAYARS